MDVKPLLAGAAVFMTAAVAGLPAQAQWNNQPYSFGSVGIGMSMAARQAILDQELTGSRPRNLYRGSDGRLSTVTRRDQQAYLVDPQPNFLVGLPRTGQVFLQLGGLGAAFHYSLAAGPRLSSAPVDAWVAMLE
jgi:hypothetical protein